MPGAEGGCRWRRIVVAGAFAALAWSTVYAKPSTYYVKEANQYTHKEISRPLKSNCATRSAKRRKIPFCEHVWLRRICSSATPNWPSARCAAREHNGKEADYLPVLADALLRQEKFTDLMDLAPPGDRNPVIKSKVRTARGVAAAGLHDQAKAETLPGEAIKLDPKALRPKIRLARLLSGTKPLG